jgi:UDP-glucuronate 4-epimerase
MSVLVTGAAGFIGFHVAQALLGRGEQVLGIDNLNDYYDPGLKRARIALLEADPGFAFCRLDIADRQAVFAAVDGRKDLRGIIHLAAHAGVLHSLTNPYAHVDANVMGTLVMLEAARRIDDLRGFVYASSSSVYGGNTKQPCSIEDRVDQPVSLYAATKRSCELMAHTYAELYGLPATGLRFFTVYGPWGRPDMAADIFTRAILLGEPIKLFNNGQMTRDFTYIDDVVAGTIAAYDHTGEGHRLYNFGNNRPERLLDFVAVLERLLGRTARRELLPMQPGDVAASWADIEASRRDLGFEPKTTIETGLARFVEWYKDYHAVG